MDSLKKLIIIILIFIILLIMLIILLERVNLNIGLNDKFKESEELIEEEQLLIPENKDLEELKDVLYYFVAKNCMQEYLENRNMEEDITFVPIDIKLIKNKEYVQNFAVYGITQDTNSYVFKESVYAVVNLDEKNLTYSIEVINNVDNINDINIEYIDDSITEIKGNTYEYQTILDQDILNEFILTYKRLSLSFPEVMYNRLEEDFRNEKFGNIDNFKKYIEKNKEQIYNINAVEYYTTDTEDSKKYTITDNYGNTYIFEGVSPIQYELILSL